ncbi:MAG: DUF3568 family protein [Syntrophaceae bacterium]|jgi:hypothetical protein|nr:DUF3568 family protein [Syntrophaceae bacterium]
MKRRMLLLIVAVACLFGCNAAMVMNGKVMGIESGKFIYQDGYLTTQYKADIDPVWKACEKAVVELKGWDVKKERKIAGGSIKTIIADEKVTILVQYTDKNLTSVSVLSGVVGNQMASRMIQDRIAANIVQR